MRLTSESSRKFGEAYEADRRAQAALYEADKRAQAALRSRSLSSAAPYVRTLPYPERMPFGFRRPTATPSVVLMFFAPLFCERWPS